jgi:hypothetical protein
MNSQIRKKSIFFYHLPVFSKISCTVIACLFLAFVVPSCKKELKDPNSKTTGRTTTLTLISAPGNPILGTATIEENKDSSFNIKLQFSNTPSDTIWADIHNGSFADPFKRQAIELGAIVGTGGNASKTILNIKKATLPDLTRITVPYDSILTFKGFINVSSMYTPHRVNNTLAHGTLGE